MAQPDGMLRLDETEPAVAPDANGNPVSEYKPPETFSGLLIENVVYTEFKDFSGVTFEGPVELRNVRFERGFSFAGATFLRSVKFSKVWNDKVPGSKADFENAKFFGTARLGQSSAFYRAVFSGATFVSTANFREAKFYATANFREAKFRSTSTFKETLFHGVGDFQGAVFSDETDFEDAVFCYGQSDARFTEAEFDGPAIFIRAQFAGDADFRSAIFRRGVSFYGCRFALRRNLGSSPDAVDAAGQEPSSDPTVDFSGATFDPEIGDREVATFEKARFGDAHQRRSVSFERCHFSSYGTDKSQPVIFTFKDVICTGEALFGEAQFHGNVAADFSNSRFEQELDLEDCLFLDEANFHRAHMLSDVFVASTRFERYPDFRQTKLTVYPRLSEAKLPSGKQALSRDEALSRTSALRKIAGRADDKRMEADLLVRELKLGGGVASLFYGAISNYGQSWVRPAGWLLVFALLVFPPLYLLNSEAFPLTREGLVAAFQTRTLPCRYARKGNAIAAALDVSVKNALVVASENAARDTRIDDCLGNGGPQGRQGFGYTLIEAAQKILTLILVFFVGASIRHRLLIR